jgi:Holliday junction resolvasome RuvABC endonuclease subunit
MRILAIDPGLHCGWAFLDGDAVFSGVWNLTGTRFESAGFRFIRLKKYLSELLKPDCVYYEEVRRHLGTDAAHCYGGMIATLQTFCDENKIPYSGIPVGTLKKFAVGKGNADKNQMVMAAKKYKPEISDDNEADAFLILQYVISSLQK